MFESKFFGRDPVKRPQCPFCGALVERPMELTTRRFGEMPVGSCGCGAVYACDETGHNLGSAMIEALVFGCDMDWDLAWGLEPETDYLREIVEHYDLNTHSVIPGGAYQGRRIAGALYFIKLHQDILEATAEGVQRRLGRAFSKTATASTRRVGQHSLTKKRVEELVEAYDIGPIVDAAREDKKVIRYLQRLLYSGDALLRKRAAEILGRACAVVGERDPGLISNLLQGLFYSLIDTAAYPPGALEAIGAIISRRPDLFGGFAPQLYQFLADATRKAQVLQALGEIAKESPSLLRKNTLYFFGYLEDPDPAVRGYAAWLMGNLGAWEARSDLEKLTSEPHGIDIYEDGSLHRKSVAQVASEALNRL